MPAVIWKGSPNWTSGRQGFRPEAIVIHIMDGSLEGTDSWFATPQSQVSAHYGVGRTGRIHQYVTEQDTAWHAGRVSAPRWAGLKPGVNPNLYTIGIEHEGTPGIPWTDAMYASSAWLLAEVSTRWRIPLDSAHVVGHCDIYQPKSFCPGTGVSFGRLIAQARAHAGAQTVDRIVTAAGTVMTRVRLNVRHGAPSASAPLATTLDPGTTFAFVGWTGDGQNVGGNAHWYVGENNLFIWAGGTDVPVPTQAAAPTD